MDQYKGSDVDKYRCFMSGEGEKNTTWKLGKPPNFDVVNKLFEEGRTKIWPPGSLEEQVQNLLKTWEMELIHKLNPKDYKSIDATKVSSSVNGMKPLTPEEVAKIGGGYNMFLQTSLPKQLRLYNPDEETVDSSNKIFTTTFPRGFVIEVLHVYSGPPVIAFKFRHWGYMEGPYKGHPPTGEVVEMFGVCTMEMDEHFKIIKVEFFYDKGEFLASLTKGARSTAAEDSITDRGSSGDHMMFYEQVNPVAMDQYKGSDVDKYRCFMSGEGEKNTTWKLGKPPNYDVVNKLFEEGRTKIWPTGSLEEQVQNFVKTWEMEKFHKVNPKDHKTVDVTKSTVSVNGRTPLTTEGVAKIGGGYNMFLQTSLPQQLGLYNPNDENVDSAHKIFTTTFPRGFAMEILQVYSGPPLLVYKFRHWGYMEGPFKGHPPTGEMVEMFGISTMQLDEQLKVVKVEFFFDRGELLAGLIKGASATAGGDSITDGGSSSCPFLDDDFRLLDK